MPRVCCVPGCKSRGNGQTGVMFFQMPLNKPKLLTNWLIVLDRRDWVPNPSSRICSLHFLPDDYLLKPNTTVPRLKPEAIPSVFPDVSESTSQDETDSSLLKQQKVEIKKTKEIKVDSKIKSKETTPKFATPLASESPSQRPRRVSKLNSKMKDYILLDDIRRHRNMSHNSTPERPLPSEKEKAAQELLSILEDSSSLSGDESSAKLNKLPSFSSKSVNGITPSKSLTAVHLTPATPSQKSTPLSSKLKSPAGSVIKERVASQKAVIIPVSNSPPRLVALSNLSPKSNNKTGKPSKKLIDVDKTKVSNKQINSDDSKMAVEEVLLPELVPIRRKVATKSTGGRGIFRNLKSKIADKISASAKFKNTLPADQGSLSTGKTKVVHQNGNITSNSETEDLANISSPEKDILLKTKSPKKAVPLAFRKTYFQVKERDKFYYFSYADLNPSVDMTKNNILWTQDNCSSSLNSEDENLDNRESEPIEHTNEEYNSDDLKEEAFLHVDDSDDDLSGTEINLGDIELTCKQMKKKIEQRIRKEVRKKTSQNQHVDISENAQKEEGNIIEATMHDDSLTSIQGDSTTTFFTDIGVSPSSISKVSKNFKVTSPVKRKKRFKTVAEIVVRTDNSGQIPSVSIDKINNLIDIENETSPIKRIKRTKPSFISGITPDSNCIDNTSNVTKSNVQETELNRLSLQITDTIKKMKLFDKVKGNTSKLTVLITTLPPIKEKEILIIKKKNLETNKEQSRELQVAISSYKNTDKFDEDGNLINPSENLHPFYHLDIPVVGACCKDIIDENLGHEINEGKSSSVENSTSQKVISGSVSTENNSSVELQNSMPDDEVNPLSNEASDNSISMNHGVRNNSVQKTINDSADLNSGKSASRNCEEIKKGVQLESIVPLQHDHTYMTIVSPSKIVTEAEMAGVDPSKELFSKLKLSESEISYRTKTSQKLRLLKETLKRKNEAINKLKNKVKFMERSIRDERRTKRRFGKGRKIVDGNSLFDHILDESGLVKTRDYRLNSSDLPLEFEENIESEEEERGCSSPITYLCEPAIDVCEKPHPDD